ncbi:hypothetical protein KAI87_16240 [Myxococcota bacterium]|nr:hypothetical protein [Myxococcota bacterium]
MPVLPKVPPTRTQLEFDSPTSTQDAQKPAKVSADEKSLAKILGQVSETFKPSSPKPAYGVGSGISPLAGGLAPTSSLSATSHSIKSQQSYEPMRVLGMTEAEAVSAAGDPGGSAFSPLHKSGDMGNRWSHAATVELVKTALEEMGAHELIASVVAHSVFPAKEYLLDVNPDWSDLPVTIELYTTPDKHNIDAKLTVTVFGDALRPEMSRAHDSSPSVFANFEMKF